jgi:hypothetical protein
LLSHYNFLSHLTHHLRARHEKNLQQMAMLGETLGQVKGDFGVFR